MSLAFIKEVKNVEVCARKTLKYPWVLYDDYRIELEGEDITSSIVISHANDYTALEVSLMGTEEMIKMDLQSMLLMRYRREHLTPTSVAFSSFKMAGQMLKGVVANALRLVLRKPMLGHEIMIAKFIDSIRNEHRVPVTPEEGRETIRVMGLILRKLSLKHHIPSVSERS